jgi:probable HAF family extracellular repeat protein
MSALIPARLVRIALLVPAVLASTAGDGLPAPLYRATVFKDAYALNDVGDVFIHSTNTVSHGYGPRAGRTSAVVPGPGGPPGGAWLSHVIGKGNVFNDRGELAGTASSYDAVTKHQVGQAEVTRLGAPARTLGDLGGGLSRATAINDAGDVVGVSITAAGDTRAFLAPRDGPMRDLGALPGRGASGALDVNNSGLAVGYALSPSDRELAIVMELSTNLFNLHYGGSSIPDDGRAVLFRDGRAIDLGTLGGASSLASAINDRGQVVGTSLTPDGLEHAFLYEDGRMIDLGTLGNPQIQHPIDDSKAADINDAGQVVGASGGRAFLFDAGTLHDLNDLLEPGSGIHELWWADAINDLGQILATGYLENGDGTVSFGSVVLTPSGAPQPSYLIPEPIPEPGTLALFSLVLAAGGVRRFRVAGGRPVTRSRPRASASVSRDRQPPPGSCQGHLLDPSR